MKISTVTTTNRTLLKAVRDTLASGDDLLLCVAFAHARGVELIRKELELAAKKRAPRLLVTTVFGDSNATDAALGSATDAGAEVRILNAPGGTYHPKVYLSRNARSAAAVIGSANLTAGLHVNVEAATHLRGARNDAALRDAWQWAEEMWDHPQATPFDLAAGPRPTESIDPELLRQLTRAVKSDPVFYTLGKQAPNRVAEVTAHGLFVETKRSKSQKAQPKMIPPWMLNIAWETLRARGEITNKELLGDLRVHRSSAVLAILRRLPGVEKLPGRAVGLRLKG